TPINFGPTVIFAIEIVKMVLRTNQSVLDRRLNDGLPLTRHKSSTSLGFTQPWLLGTFFINIIGGRSPRYQFAGTSTSPVSRPFLNGFCSNTSVKAFLESCNHPGGHNTTRHHIPSTQGPSC